MTVKASARLETLEEERCRLKGPEADAMLDQALKGVAAGCFWGLHHQSDRVKGRADPIPFADANNGRVHVTRDRRLARRAVWREAVSRRTASSSRVELAPGEGASSRPTAITTKGLGRSRCEQGIAARMRDDERSPSLVSV
jgi:hypothetical protein